MWVQTLTTVNMPAVRRVLVVSNSSDERDSYLWRDLLRRDPSLVFVGFRGKAGPRHHTWQQEFPTRAFVLPGVRPGSHSSLWMRGLSRFLTLGNFSLVHYVFEPWSIIPQVFASSTPFSVHCAENVVSTAPRVLRLRRLGISRVLSRASGLVTWGETSLLEMLPLSQNSSIESFVCPSSPPLFKGLLPFRPGDRSSGLKVGMVARLVREKGADLLLDAAWELRHTGIEVRIMGSGPERGKLSGHPAVRSRIGRLDGPGTESDVDALIRWSDVMVVPSRVTASWTEQWGRSAVESMLAGRPTVVSSSGELPYIQDEPWLRFEADNSRALTEVLTKLQKPRALEMARSASIRQSRRFHIEHLADGMEDFWERTIRSSLG